VLSDGPIYPGETIDIHGGGADLIFPHHENEIAQSEARTGKPLARFWVHNGLVMVGGEEMHKSLGNFEYARDIVDRYGKEAVRLFFLSKHYRKPVNFSHEAVEEARSAVERVYNLLEEIEASLSSGPRIETEAESPDPAFSAYLDGVKAEFEQEMDSDFNTAGGLGVIFELIRRTNAFLQVARPEDQPLLRRAGELIRELGRPLGLFQEEPRARRRAIIAGTAGISAGLEEGLINLLVEVRSELRAKGEFALADRIRARLNELGIELRDKDGETRWSLKRLPQGQGQ
jgi:cysteinyl-tRNA synthetase